jgi:hypothetical protein
MQALERRKNKLKIPNQIGQRIKGKEKVEGGYLRFPWTAD